MAKDSAIAWTNNTYNPWIGCTKVSPACDNCYAESYSQQKRWVTAWGKDTPRYIPKTTRAQVQAWQRGLAKTGGRKCVFCASLADIFEAHPTAEAERPRLWDLIRATPNLDWLLLTKRSDGYRRMMPADLLALPNVWPGVTVESSRFLPRADDLIELGPVAGVKWISYEPAVEPVDFTSHLIQGIEWVIVGGESKQPLGTRPLVPSKLEWARDVIAQCRATGAVPFVKQLGSAHGSKHTDPSTWPEALRVREYPRSTVKAMAEAER
jgi:protein gp37